MPIYRASPKVADLSSTSRHVQRGIKHLSSYKVLLLPGLQPQAATLATTGRCELPAAARSQAPEELPLNTFSCTILRRTHVVSASICSARYSSLSPCSAYYLG